MEPHLGWWSKEKARERERETVGGKKREIVAVFALHVEAVQNPGFAEENKHTLQFDMNSYEFIEVH